MLSCNKATKNNHRAFGPEKLDRENLAELLECIRILAPYIASWVFCLKKISNQLNFQQIRQINPDKAYVLSRTLCLLIPNQCSRYFLAINNTPVGACDLNPLRTCLKTKFNLNDIAT